MVSLKIKNQGSNRSVTVGEPFEPVVPTNEVDSEVSVTLVSEEILVKPNRWIEMACQEAIDSVTVGGGPFGAVLLQIDDETRQVIRLWMDHNHVTEHLDPTAHAEISVIRAACQELGVIDLGRIEKSVSRLPQQGETSHCEIFSSCEPCPMCYSAIAWARIPALVFSASRFDASRGGVGFQDEELHADLMKDYPDRKIRVHQAPSSRALEAFELWKAGGFTRY
jgi:tRNA(Arg) A34 adenosine deaminase TadA